MDSQTRNQQGNKNLTVRKQATTGKTARQDKHRQDWHNIMHNTLSDKGRGRGVKHGNATTKQLITSATTGRGGRTRVRCKGKGSYISNSFVHKGGVTIVRQQL
jgi:hypothetical protein